MRFDARGVTLREFTTLTIGSSGTPNDYNHSPINQVESRFAPKHSF